MPFDGVVSRFGLPTTGARPEQFFRPEDEAIARYRQYLTTGSDELPVAQPSGGDLDESDWAAISKTSDPAGTLKLIDQLKSRKDYDNGVREIGELDWSNPGKAAQELAGIYAKRPHAGKQLQQFGSGVYKMLGIPKPAVKGPATLGDAGAAAIADLVTIRGDDPQGIDKLVEFSKKHYQVLSEPKIASAFERLHNHFLTSGIRSLDAKTRSEEPKDLSITQERSYIDALKEYQDSFPDWYGKPEMLPTKDVEKLLTPEGNRPKTDKEWWDARVKKANEIPSAAVRAKDRLKRLIDVTGDKRKIPDAAKDVFGSKPAAAAPAPVAIAPPQAAILDLQQNPGLAAQFDIKYGPGVSAKFLK